MIALFAGPMMLFEYWVERSKNLLQLTRVSWILRSAVYSYCAFMLLVFHPTVNHEFIYFQF